jgi:rod shape-determining protein MreB and related proteins
MFKTPFTECLYIQISPALVTVRNPKTQAFVSEVPEVAVLSDSKAKIAKIAKIATVGAGSRAVPGAAVHNPFAHPRSLVSDFTLAHQLLTAFAARLGSGGWLKPSPQVVIHPLGEHEGGLTQVEIRVLHELALGLGASKVVVWQGASLSDEQLLAWEFPSTGTVLGR